MKIKHMLTLLLILCLALPLTGCRRRTTQSGAPEQVHAQEGQTDASQEGANLTEAQAPTPGDDASGAQTRDNPDASRKEFDENAPAEIVPGTDHSIHGAGEGDGAPVSSQESEAQASHLNDLAQESATQTVPADQADDMGISDDADAADSSLTYYTVLLSSRSASLFECQRANVYLETAQDHVTVHKTSPEHALIVNAGAYDVSARLLPGNLQVDDGWIARKNPTVIVKLVDSGVLGGGVMSTGAARTAYESLLRRDGWQGIDAVRSGKVVLLCEEVLSAPYLQTAAMLVIAKTASPDLYADVDLEQALQALMQEATGTLPVGIYYYVGGA